MEQVYLETIALIERLHRRLLELVKLELEVDGIYDINNIQSMILYHVGDMEMSVGELTLRGCYLGSNVSYNLKRLAENGYIVQERSSHDHRSLRVRLSDKGLALCEKIKSLHMRHLSSLGQSAEDSNDLMATCSTLHAIVSSWSQVLSNPARTPALSSAA